MEQIDLTTPYQPNPAVTSVLRVVRLTLDWESQLIHIVLKNNGVNKEEIYTGQTATDLMVALNKANLSTKSLHKRILEKLIADGRLSGAISGAPD